MFTIQNRTSKTLFPEKQVNLFPAFELFGLWKTKVGDGWNGGKGKASNCLLWK